MAIHVKSDLDLYCMLICPNTKGNNSKSEIARVTFLVHGKWSRDDTPACKVSLHNSNLYMIYGPDKSFR